MREFDGRAAAVVVVVVVVESDDTVDNKADDGDELGISERNQWMDQNLQWNSLIIMTPLAQ